MEIGDEQILNYDLIEDLFTLMQKIVATEDAKKVLLTLRLIREQDDYYIPDEDREIFNEAIRAKLDLKYIDDLLLQDYPRAFESGGCVIISNTHFTPLVLYVVKQSLLS